MHFAQLFESQVARVQSLSWQNGCFFVRENGAEEKKALVDHTVYSIRQLSRVILSPSKSRPLLLLCFTTMFCRKMSWPLTLVDATVPCRNVCFVTFPVFVPSLSWQMVGRGYHLK
eukprot:COSAG06_NODE_44421_length_363_cov_1.314394_1_plen_114_part_10